MKLASKNIVKSFFTRAIITIVILSVTSISFIYFYEKNLVFKNLANSITHHINQVLTLSNKKDMSVSDEFFIKHMKMVDFVSFKIYDKNKKDIFTFLGPNRDKNILKFLDHEHISNEIYYKFLTTTDKNYFLLVSYPAYKNGNLLGYIEGVKQIDESIVKNLKKKVTYMISTILIVIIFFSSAIFPLIYIAYKKLNSHKNELLTNNIMTINTLGNTIALRDSDTNEHNYRVTIYAIKLALEVNLKKNLLEKLMIGAFLHDIGKIGISDNILLKNGKFTEEEFKIIKSHVIKGAQIIHGNEWLELGEDVILYHHEKYDGTGYPHKKAGDDIPIIARIFAVVDVFDAITSQRPYKKAYDYNKAMQIMKESKNTHFDPVILDSFIKISHELYTQTYLKSHKDLKKEVNTLISKCFLKDECMIYS